MFSSKGFLLVAFANLALAVSSCGPTAKTDADKTVGAKPQAVAPEELEPEGDWPIIIAWKSPVTNRVPVSEAPNLRYRKIKDVEAKELELVSEFIAKDGSELVKERLNTDGFEVSESEGDLSSPKLSKYGLRWQDIVLSLAGDRLRGDGDMKVALFDGETQVSNWLTIPITMEKPDTKDQE